MDCTTVEEAKAYIEYQKKYIANKNNVEIEIEIVEIPECHNEWSGVTSPAQTVYRPVRTNRCPNCDYTERASDLTQSYFDNPHECKTHDGGKEYIDTAELDRIWEEG